jgi:hypothetical protein
MAKNRVKGGECAACGTDMSELRRWEAQKLVDPGWYVHLVTDHDDQSPTGFNVHTHGLDLKGKLDFQIVCPLPAEIVHSIINILARRAYNGEEFVPGQEVSEVLAGGFLVKLALAEECERKVLRVLMPDKKGKFGLKAVKSYALQVKGTLAVG